MIGHSILDALTKRAVSVFLSTMGNSLSTTTCRNECSTFKSVSWTNTVLETPLITPEGDGSIEILDIILLAEKKNNGTVRLHFDDGTNEVEVINGSVSDSALNIASNFIGKIRGWQGAILYYTIAAATFSGSMLITYVKHNEGDSLVYADWDARR